MWIQNNWRRLQETIQQFGWEERLIIGIVLLAILIAIAVYVVRRMRQWLQQPNASISEHLSDFRRMRDAGELDEKEFSLVVNTFSRREKKGEIPGQKEPPAHSENLPSPTEGG
jgi:hypothetical protein